MKQKLLLVLICSGLVLFAIALTVGSASATNSPPSPVFQDTSNDTCLSCHGQPGQTTTLPSGEKLYIGVDPEAFANSVHGQQEIACVACHTDITGYPHPPIAAQTRREYTLEQREVCAACHTRPYEQKVNDAHTLAFENGNQNAAVCSDCHGAHDITPPDEPRSRIPQTCQRCHSQIYELYKTSVHGEALLGEGNPDVPSCVDCHNSHNVQGVSNTAFHLFSPQICARCHANDDLMDKYGINTDVFDTYVSDFHGTTVTLYQAVAPGQETNKPVCVDCHGVHDMQQVESGDDPQIKANILVTCQRCHPGATENFPGSWLSHYPASPQHAPLVFFARMFYAIFIPGVLIPMAIFIVGDISRRVNKRERK